MINQVFPPSGQELQNGMMMLHSNQIEQLRELVVHWLKQYPLAPLEQEIFLVQSDGMAQWLKLALAADSGHGIALGMRMDMPSRFLWQIYRQVLGEEAVPKTSPFDKPQLRWRLLRLLPELVDGDDFEPLQRFLSGDQPQRKQAQLAEQLADLYDQYQVYRADWLQQWTNGNDVIVSAKGVQSPLAPKQRWQAKLWRAILADMDELQRQTSRAELHQCFVTQLQTAPPQGLPRRVVVFGISALPKQTIEALAALAPYCQIILCVNNPCQHYWGDIVEDRDLFNRQLAQNRHQRKPGIPEELDESLQHNHVNPLLAAWGKQGRDYIGMLYEYDQPEQYQGQFQQIDLFEPPQGERLLQQVQQGIFDLQPRPNQPLKIDASDDSIEIVQAHSRQREVEILHDYLLRRFADNPQLNPADVIVMMPDVSQYGPHIDAVFGRLESDDPRYLPYTIADRPQRGHQVMLLALETLFDLTQARFSVSELLDLLAVPALRARFDISETELPLLSRWIEQAGIRWGLHGEQRQQLELPANLEQNTWSFGLKRMLLGYAVGEGDPWQGIEPCEEIGGLDAAAVGKLAALIDALESVWRFFSQSWAPSQWSVGIAEALDRLFVAQDEVEAGIIIKLKDALTNWHQACDDARLAQLLPVTVIKEICLEPFATEGVSQRFLVGKINFCTLMPMRAIPFKQVCLLGLNDEDYPRSRPPLDFDLMAAAGQLDGAGAPIPSQYRPGDRSRREDDRYLFLEAILASRQWLLLSYIGFSARDNSERTPSVLLGQLQDHLGQSYFVNEPGDLLNHLSHAHPLQPFSRSYFDGIGAEQSFAVEWQRIHQPLPEKPEQALPVWQPQVAIGLRDLAALLKDPAKLFLGRRLGIWLEIDDQANDDLEPFEFDGLENHQFRTELFANLMQSSPEQMDATVTEQIQRWKGRGELPVGAFGDFAATQLTAPALAAYQQVVALTGEWQQAQPIEVKYSQQGLELEDWLTQVYLDHGNTTLLTVLPQPLLGDKASLRKPLTIRLAWLQHLAANSQYLKQQQQVHSYVVASDSVWYFAPLEAAAARQHLDTILKAYRQGMEQPLPLAEYAGRAYLAEMQISGDEAKALAKAETAFTGDARSGGDLSFSVYQQRCWSRFSDIAELGFQQQVQALYQPIVDHVQLERSNDD